MLFRSLIKQNKKTDLLPLRKYDYKRCKNILRIALSINHEKKYTIFKMLLKRQLITRNIKDMFKTTFGFITIIIFSKGDSLFK